MPESVASEVVSAMVGGMFSASALYPLEVLKTRMQAESKVSGNNPQEETAADDDDEHQPNSSGSSSSGGSAEIVSKQQLKNEYSNAAQEGMTSYATLMYHHEGGIAPFYSGVVTSAVQSATEKALYFFAYTFFKNGWVNNCVMCGYYLCGLFFIVVRGGVVVSLFLMHELYTMIVMI